VKLSSKYSYNYNSNKFTTDRLSRNSSKRTANLKEKKKDVITPHRSAARINSTKEEHLSIKKKLSLLDKYKSKS
jgi:Asp/Glu/hydantoin racemase